jgi:hypothetical protein
MHHGGALAPPRLRGPTLCSQTKLKKLALLIKTTLLLTYKITTRKITEAELELRFE